MTAPVSDTEAVRAQVLPLALERLSYREIAERLKLSPGVVNTTIYRLRKAGKLPPAPPQVQQGSIGQRLLEEILAAGGTGLSRRVVIDRAGLQAQAVRRALRHLLKYGLIRREPDGLLLAADAERLPAEPETIGERRAATGPLANVVSYALTLVEAGSPDRAALFLMRAAERIDGGREPRAPEAVNLLALADLIRFGDGRTYAGKIERIEIDREGGEA